MGPPAIPDDRHVDVLIDEHAQQIGRRLVGRGIVQWPDDPAQVGSVGIGPHEVDQFLEVDVAHDAIQIALFADGETRVGFEVRGDQGLADAHGGGQERQVFDRDHDVARLHARQTRGPVNDPFLVPADLIREAGQPGQRRDFLHRVRLIRARPSPFKRLVDPVHQIHDRAHERGQHGQWSGDPHGDVPVVTHANRSWAGSR